MSFSAWDVGRSPYPGLAPFREDQSAVFFGRREQTSEVLRRMNGDGARVDERFVPVIGPVDSGKSSLVRAGVLPRVRAQPWNVLPVMVPGSDPFAALARTVTDDPARADDHARRLRRGDGDLAAILDGARRASGSGHRRTLLVVDQFHELDTLCGQGDRALFLCELSRALERDRSLRVLASVRTRSFSAGLRGREAGLFLHPIALGAPTRSDLVEIVEGPARVAGLRLEDGLARRIAAETRGDDLPFLAYLLQRLHTRAGTGGLATEGDYLALGGVALGLETHIGQVQVSLRPDVGLGRVMRVLLHFASYADETVILRRVRSADVDDFDDLDRRVVDAFVDAGLLITDVHEGEAVVRAIHAGLFLRWRPLLREMVTQSWPLRQRDRIEERAREWEEFGRNPDYLLVGQERTSAEVALEKFQKDGRATRLMIEFVAASRRDVP